VAGFCEHGNRLLGYIKDVSCLSEFLIDLVCCCVVHCHSSVVCEDDCER
jgi:hypothetical protein